MIIAVDGPAASGKGTIARALATHYGLPHLDTGLLYRAVGLTLLRAGGDPESEADAAAATTFPDSVLADPELRTEATGALASRVSAHAAVRAALMARQRAFAHQPGGAVLDGRDIGTVIAPEAGAKLYVTASPRVRAERRAREMERMGQTPDIPAMEAEIMARDARDMARQRTARAGGRRGLARYQRIEYRRGYPAGDRSRGCTVETSPARVTVGGARFFRAPFCAFHVIDGSIFRRMFVRHGAVRAMCKPKTLGYNRVACNDVKKD